MSVTEENVTDKNKSVPYSLLDIHNAGFHAILVKMGEHHEYDAHGLIDRLTEAEAAVARAAVSGLSNREIAKQRGSAARTVAVQLRSIYRKLGISSRTELAALIEGDTEK